MSKNDIKFRKCYCIESMKNWSGNQKWTPQQILYPETEEEIKAIVFRAAEEKKSLRTIGSGHSFTPLSVTDAILLSLDKYQGVISVDDELQQVTVKAGTKLHALNELLAEEGLALANMGDINVQSIAGAISTGTHGTGIEFGNLSTLITRLKFINGLGEEVVCSENDNREWFKAAQISLGAMGVITEVTLQCVPAYRLELRIGREKIEDVWENLAQTLKTTRNFEFYWFLNTSWTMTKYLNETDEPAEKPGWKDYFQEKLLENYIFKILCDTSVQIPSFSGRLNKIAAATIDDYRKVDHSYRVFSTSRLVRFNEMEYNIPIEAYVDVKKEIVRWVNKNARNVVFPMENRFVKGDDIWLSPAYQRDSAYIAVHMYHKKHYHDFFSGIEEIFKANGGRPHWGKMHTLQADELQERYEEFDRFSQVRREHDPEGIFLSPYLKSILMPVL